MEQVTHIAAIVFIASMCDDSGRAITGSWRIYTRRREYVNGFYDEAPSQPTEEKAREWCKANGCEVVSVQWG